jgi:branched-chain amino acid transport system ATP-binding protein
MVLLNVENLTASYGVTQALFGVDLSVQKGGVTALLGRNGVGKSTTIKSICRMLPYRSGSVEFDQTDLTQLPTHEAIKLGIGLVPEGRRCFSNLNVEQNLMVAARSGSWNFDRVTELFPRLAERRLQIASTLSGGEQQMLAIGRALMTNPKLLIWAAIKKLKSGENLSILVVDKSLKELTQVADHAVVLARGETVWSGAIRELSDDIKDRYLGV